MSTVKSQAERSIIANASSIAEKAIKVPGPVIGKAKAKPAPAPAPTKKPAVKVVAKPKAAPAVVKAPVVAKAKAPVTKPAVKKQVAPDVITQAKKQLAQAVSHITDEKPVKSSAAPWETPSAVKLQQSGFSGSFGKSMHSNSPAPAPASGKPLSWAEVAASMKNSGSLKA